MKLLLEHKATLLKEILSASSQEDVQRLIKEGIALLEKNGIDDQITWQLVNKLTKELDLLSPIKKNPQQWSNIKIAKIQFFRIKKRLEALPSE